MVWTFKLKKEDGFVNMSPAKPITSKPQTTDLSLSLDVEKAADKRPETRDLGVIIGFYTIAVWAWVCWAVYFLFYFTTYSTCGLGQEGKEPQHRLLLLTFILLRGCFMFSAIPAKRRPTSTSTPPPGPRISRWRMAVINIFLAFATYNVLIIEGRWKTVLVKCGVFSSFDQDFMGGNATITTQVEGKEESSSRFYCDGVFYISCEVMYLWPSVLLIFDIFYYVGIVQMLFIPFEKIDLILTSTLTKLIGNIRSEIKEAERKFWAIVEIVVMFAIFVWPFFYFLSHDQRTDE